MAAGEFIPISRGDNFSASQELAGNVKGKRVLQCGVAALGLVVLVGSYYAFRAAPGAAPAGPTPAVRALVVVVVLLVLLLVALPTCCCC